MLDRKYFSFEDLLQTLTVDVVSRLGAAAGAAVVGQFAAITYGKLFAISKIKEASVDFAQ